MISIHANGKVFSGFTAAEVSRSLDAAVSDLNITVAAWTKSTIPPGSQVEVFVNDQRVITGYMSRFKGSRGSRDTKTSLVVRSKTCDLTDSDAEPQTFVGQTPFQLAATLAKPHGVEVVALTEFSKIPKVRVQPGEKIFATIERSLKSQYGLISDDPYGRLTLSQVTSEMDDGSKRRLVLGTNILNIDYDFDWDQRFKTIRMVGQGAGAGNVDPRQTAVATDENAERNRLLILVGGAQYPGVTARNRVEWEKNQRIGKAIQVEVECQGWIDPTGVVWLPNVMVSLTDPSIGWTNVPLLVVSTKFTVNNSGQSVTHLSLRPWKAYAPPPADLVSVGGRGGGSRFRTPFLTERQKEWASHPPVPFLYEKQAPWMTDKQMKDLAFKSKVPKLKVPRAPLK